MQKENEDEKRLAEACIRSLFVATCVVILMAIICLCCGCSTTKYLPIDNVITKTDTVYSTKIHVDAVQVRDSIAVIQKGDTVTITKYRDRFRIRERIDTIYKAVTDSVEVRVSYPVERELTSWEKTKMVFGGMTIGGLSIIAAIMCGLLLWRKFKE